MRRSLMFILTSNNGVSIVRIWKSTHAHLVLIIHSIQWALCAMQSANTRAREINSAHCVNTKATFLWVCKCERGHENIFKREHILCTCEYARTYTYIMYPRPKSRAFWVGDECARAAHITGLQISLCRVKQRASQV